MIDVPEAYDILFSRIQPGPTVQVELEKAAGRTLAAPVCTDGDYPPFDRAVMDGFAVRSVDLAHAPTTLKVIDHVAAGALSVRCVQTGEAIQINTGAPIPPGADAVVRLEDTETIGTHGKVVVRHPVPPGEFITPRASYVSAGQVVLPAGMCLTPLALAAAAAAGASMVRVYGRPSVAVLTTGNELVEPHARAGAGQIRNSNQPLLAALTADADCQPVVLGTAGDDRSALRERILRGLQEDVLCITGGISAGAFDFVPDVLRSLGADFHIHKMAIKPGRPTIFATTKNGRLVFALPGNPASAFVGFELLVRPALAALQGRQREVPAMFTAALRGTIPATRDRRTYLPARVRAALDGGLTAETLPWHGSGDPFGLAPANGLIMRPPRSEPAQDGVAVTAFLIGRL